MLKYFNEKVEKIYQEISKVTWVKLLDYQELMNFLSFSLTLEENEIKMPKVPLYMDALLSQDVKFEFKANDIHINGKKVLILSLSDLSNVWEMFEEIKQYEYRYVRRILIFDERESEIEMKKYCGNWCPNRKIMLREIERGILSNFNGYYWNGFILLLDETKYEEVRTHLEKTLTLKESAFVFEKYNLKDVWWGSLAGMYLANITPPLVGFESIEEFILHNEKIQTERQEHKFKKILEEIENVPNGQI